jgi:hypothetical protein
MAQWTLILTYRSPKLYTDRIVTPPITSDLPKSAADFLARGRLPDASRKIFQAFWPVRTPNEAGNADRSVAIQQSQLSIEAAFRQFIIP